jgi:phosphoribosylanthranilate isomerase
MRLKSNKMPLAVKICGLSTKETVVAAVERGAAFVGFVFFAKSPRNVSPQHVNVLAQAVPSHVSKVGLLVDASDDEIESILKGAPLDMVQLHGSETPERVSAIKAKFSLPVMKVIAVSDAADIKMARAYEPIADRLLFDAKPPEDASRPGGLGEAFNGGLLAGKSFAVPWMLAGGLTADNLAGAVAASGAPGVDVSSGVEDGPGDKNISKIKAFLDIAASL